MTTIYCQLIAKEMDFCGYETYVFKCLESNIPFGHKYYMVTRLPNWQHRELDLNEVGFLSYKEVIAGKDCWFCPDTGEQIPYNYTNVYFIKFVKEVDNSKKDIII